MSDTVRVSIRVPAALHDRVIALGDVIFPDALPHTDTDAYLRVLLRGAEVMEAALAARRKPAAPTRTPIPDDDGWIPPED